MRARAEQNISSVYLSDQLNKNEAETISLCMSLVHRKYLTQLMPSESELYFHISKDGFIAYVDNILLREYENEKIHYLLNQVAFKTLRNNKISIIISLLALGLSSLAYIKKEPSNRHSQRLNKLSTEDSLIKTEIDNLEKDNNLLFQNYNHTTLIVDSLLNEEKTKK